MTSDNGKEFGEHKTISQMVGIDFFFAKPYHSCERGANENADGLIRPYFHKGTSFEK
jgi:IS30 family transposase